MSDSSTTPKKRKTSDDDDDDEHAQERRRPVKFESAGNWHEEPVKIRINPTDKSDTSQGIIFLPKERMKELSITLAEKIAVMEAQGQDSIAVNAIDFQRDLTEPIEDPEILLDAFARFALSGQVYFDGMTWQALNDAWMVGCVLRCTAFLDAILDAMVTVKNSKKTLRTTDRDPHACHQDVEEFWESGIILSVFEENEEDPDRFLRYRRKLRRVFVDVLIADWDEVDFRDALGWAEEYDPPEVHNLDLFFKFVNRRLVRFDSWEGLECHFHHHAPNDLCYKDLFWEPD